MPPGGRTELLIKILTIVRRTKKLWTTTETLTASQNKLVNILNKRKAFTKSHRLLQERHTAVSTVTFLDVVKSADLLNQRIATIGDALFITLETIKQIPATYILLSYYH